MSKDLDVGWLPQERAYFCGPAVAQMALTSFGTAAPGQPPTWQEQLWDGIQTETNAKRPSSADDDASACPPFPEQKCDRYDGDWFCWSTTPDALQRVLGGQQNKTSYAVSAHEYERDATAELRRSVDNGAPGAALVYGWLHWVLVDGYVADAAGGTTHVCLRDPLDRRLGDTHEVAIADWNLGYLSFVPAGRYRDKVVVVCGVGKALADASAAPVPLRGAAPGPRPVRETDHKPPGEHALVPAEAAREAADRELRRMLERPKRWGRALADAVQDRSEPLLVERLDRHDTYLYVVTYHTGLRATARILIDARTGRFSQAAGANQERGALAPFVDPEDAIERLRSRGPELRRIGTRLLRRETIGRHPVLVWKPCRESTSPSMPFYQFSVGDRFVYLRADGVWFDQLTTGPA
jgi:hypothetical protein